MIRLTDDEVVAVVVSRGGVWPTVLPTVDVTDQEDLAAACARGIRSLAVRGLVGEAGAGDEQVTGEVGSLAGAIAGGAGMVVVAGVEAAAPHLAEGPALVLIAVDGGLLADVISAGGVHVLSAVTLDDGRRALSVQAEAVFARQSAAHGPASALAVMSTLGSGGLAMVMPGSFELGSFVPGEGGPAFSARRRVAVWSEAETALHEFLV